MNFKYYSKKYWKKESKRITSLNLPIPKCTLKKVDNIELKDQNSFKNIPDIPGCYWIWTNAPIKHVLHRREIPKSLDNGKIIYNGVAQSVQSRVIHHLLNKDMDEGMSGVSIDIYIKSGDRSHNKTAMYTGSRKQKLPLIIRDTTQVDEKLRVIQSDKIICKDILLKLFLSKKEKSFINNFRGDTIYFRNGINIFDRKHKNYNYKIFYIVEIDKTYIDYIEKNGEKNMDYQYYVHIRKEDNLWLKNGF